MHKNKDRYSSDSCRICGNTCRLTEDHVPPRSWTTGQATQQRTSLDYFSNPKLKLGRFSQNGVKFKTICGACNSVLGSKYDPEVARLIKLVIAMGGGLSRKYEVAFTTRPSRIIRSVLGHLVAGTNQNYYSEFDVKVKEFLSSEDNRLPSSFRVYYWIHPFEDTVIMRDIAIGWLSGGITFSQVLKFYPLGFLVTQDEEIPAHLKIPYLTDCEVDARVTIPIPPLVEIKGWPEYPDNDRFTLGRLDNGTHAIPKISEKTN